MAAQDNTHEANKFARLFWFKASATLANDQLVEINCQGTDIHHALLGISMSALGFRDPEGKPLPIKKLSIEHNPDGPRKVVAPDNTLIFPR